MQPKPKRRKLPKPSVFKYGDRWVCEYYLFDEEGRPKPSRKSFVRDLQRQGQEPTLEAQRTAAINYRDAILKEKREQERLERREREQTYLTLAELKEAKVAFGIFNQIPSRSKSLVDAVILYREHLKLAEDSPSLKHCVQVFLGRKKEAAGLDEGDQRLSPETYRTLRQRLNHMVGYFEAQKLGDIKLGQVTSKHLIGYFESLEASDRTRRNYVNDIGNFFNDAADPKDKNRFINENPMDGVYVYFRKFNKGKAAQNRKKTHRKAPTILQLDQVRHVLRVAMEAREEGMLGFTVAGLFLGMRPSEVVEMSEQDDFWERFIKLEEGIVRVDGVGKKRDQRIILMSDNCKAWLQYLQEHQLPFCYQRKKTGIHLPFATFRARAFLFEDGQADKLIKLRRKRRAHNPYTPEEKSFVTACNKQLGAYEDVLRHTFGSNFYYANGYDKNKTIEQMGHSGEVFVEHYRGLLNNPKDAEAYFELYPDDI
ncbi:site-specific integrase [Ruficoccus amylovorans]|uniref:Site-specific integrase n=1 Tax=Ruficoccus amylovorans TaxID=1804625 RepID=A0A842HJS7_9BACT|nr:site-specific integrase [Ruficoccus amylovorans]MBC2595411.1 site-specific integrase [Ruficoccus amylovorans]